MLWIFEELPYFEWSILLLGVDSVADPIGSFGGVGGLFEVDSSRSAVFIKRQQQPAVINLASRLLICSSSWLREASKHEGRVGK